MLDELQEEYEQRKHTATPTSAKAQTPSESAAIAQGCGMMLIVLMLGIIALTHSLAMIHLTDEIKGLRKDFREKELRPVLNLSLPAPPEPLLQDPSEFLEQ
jgi:hypothetical protein